MADEQYRWLDRDTAERLLRGEPLDAVDADSRDQADRLTEALEALDALGTQTADPTPADAELPGEAAALAAFRKARTGKNGEQAGLGPRTRARSTSSASAASSAASQISSDAGLVHLGRPVAHGRVPSRWGRPMRYGLAAALAAGMIGGAAMVAASGVLRFGGEEPEPGASASVAVTPDRPHVSPSPEKKPGGGPDVPRPDGSAGGPTGKGSVPGGEARGGTDPGARTDPGDDRREGRPGRGWRWLTSACRDYRDGKNLDSERRHGLEDAANGAEQVNKYCKGLLNNRDDRDSGDGRHGNGSGRGESGRGGSGWNNDREGRDGDGRDGDGRDGDGRDGRGSDDDGDGGGDGSHIGAGAFRGGSGTVLLATGAAEPTAFTPARPSAFAPARLPATRTPTPVRTLLQAPSRTSTRTSTQAPTARSAQSTQAAPSQTPVRAPVRALATDSDAGAPARSTGPKPRSAGSRASAPHTPRALPALSSPS